MEIHQVDAFAGRLFSGNPAAVCIVDNAKIDDSTMQNIAAEMNLSETAFVIGDGGGYTIRWFTAETEVPLCGHATLASAHILWETNRVSPQRSIMFRSMSGDLGARLRAGRVELNFPQKSVETTGANGLIDRALGISATYTGKDTRRYLIEIDEPQRLRSLNPDFGLLAQCDLAAFMVTCKSDDPAYDFLSRFFAPGVGIEEDPVTGSAHCYLAPYWSSKLGKTVLRAYQASQRGGEIECEVIDGGRVLLRGDATTVFSGELKLTTR